jgi:hypothetical protein
MLDTRVVEVISMETSGTSTILFGLMSGKWKWLLMNGCTYKTLICTMLEVFNSCH